MEGKKIGQLFSGEIEGGSYQSISLEGLGAVSRGLYMLNIVGADFKESRKVLVE
ncbi:MAG: hypothetical protein AAFQ68_11600 [Bacteroidota bacterium]